MNGLLGIPTRAHCTNNLTLEVEILDRPQRIDQVDVLQQTTRNQSAQPHAFLTLYRVGGITQVDQRRAAGGKCRGVEPAHNDLLRHHTIGIPETSAYIEKTQFLIQGIGLGDMTKRGITGTVRNYRVLFSATTSGKAADVMIVGRNITRVDVRFRAIIDGLGIEVSHRLVAEKA